MPTKTDAQPSFTIALLGILFVTGCAMFGGIPDLDTPDGQIYARRCGGCHGTSYMRGHGVPDPRFRTMAEWEQILPKMDQLIRERGLAPLGELEREAIIRYLRQHAKL
jgi:hypothetical protein